MHIGANVRDIWEMEYGKGKRENGKWKMEKGKSKD